MTDRAVFGRRYTSYQPAGTQVWLLNGTAVTAQPSATETYTAGANLAQGTVVYVSGVYALPASAASGVTPAEFQVIGVTTEAATASSAVSVALDNTAIVNAGTITAETVLIPGEYYYLSKYSGEITRYSTASGVVSLASGYAALVTLGQALSNNELSLEIEPPVVLTD